MSTGLETHNGATNPKYDPAAEGEDFDFYGKPDRRAWIWLRPYEPAAESPDSEYPFWLNTAPDPGTLAYRFHDPARAHSA